MTKRIGGLSYSPGTELAMTLQKQKTEARWARRSGKVTVRKVDPASLPSKRKQIRSPFRPNVPE